MHHTTPAPQQARVHGSPGARLRGLGLIKSLWPLILIFAALGYLLRAAFPSPPLSRPVTGMLFLALAVFVAAATNTARRKLANHMKGARGEEVVARHLADLPPAHHVFHGVGLHPGWRDLSGGADIDHVVVGPQGILAIETKHWLGSLSMQQDELLLDDDLPDRDPFEQAAEAAARLEQYLRANRLQTPAVIPVLVFSATPPPAECGTVHGNVLVTHVHSLNNLILSPPTKDTSHLSADTIRAVVQTLIRKVES